MRAGRLRHPRPMAAPPGAVAVCSTTWPFVPPKPKEETEAVTRPLLARRMLSVGNRTAKDSKSSWHAARARCSARGAKATAILNRIRPDCWRLRPTSAKSGPHRATLDPSAGRIRPNSRQSQPNPARFGRVRPSPAQIRPILTDLGRKWPNLCRTWKI